MKSFQQFCEETGQLNEVSKKLLKRYLKKANAETDSLRAKEKLSDTDKQKLRRRSGGYFKSYDKLHGYAKVNATGGPTAAQNKKVKDIADSIAKAHPNLKVSSHKNDHFIHHKDDEDGNEHIHVTFAGNGKVKVSHSYGATSGSEKTMSNADAVKYGHSIVKGK